MMTSLQNIISGPWGIEWWLDPKFLIMMTWSKNIILSILVFSDLVIFIKNFDPFNIWRPWASKIAMLCSEVIMIKLLNLSKAKNLGYLFVFTSLSTRNFSTLLLFLDLECFKFRLSSYKHKGWHCYIVVTRFQ